MCINSPDWNVYDDFNNYQQAKTHAAVDVRNSLVDSINGEHIPGISEPLIQLPVTGDRKSQVADMSSYYDDANAWKHASDMSLGNESAIRLAEFPPLGSEFTDTELEQMTRRYKRREWRKDQKNSILHWFRDRNFKRRFRLARPRLVVAVIFVLLVMCVVPNQSCNSRLLPGPTCAKYVAAHKQPSDSHQRTQSFLCQTSMG